MIVVASCTKKIFTHSIDVKNQLNNEWIYQRIWSKNNETHKDLVISGVKNIMVVRYCGHRPHSVRCPWLTAAPRKTREKSFTCISFALHAPNAQLKRERERERGERAHCIYIKSICIIITLSRACANIVRLCIFHPPATALSLKHSFCTFQSLIAYILVAILYIYIYFVHFASYIPIPSFSSDPMNLGFSIGCTWCWNLGYNLSMKYGVLEYEAFRSRA